MKKVGLIIASIILAAVAISCGETGNKTKQVEEKKFEAIEVSIDSLLTDASALEGKTVRFTAKVDHTCMHGGKRLTVFGSVEGKTLKVDATESSPAFVSSLMGKQVDITGIVRKLPDSHVADCEADEGNEVTTFAYVVECLTYEELK